mgnify:CR=1 FL=1|jgi:hypothetical protein
MACDCVPHQVPTYPEGHKLARELMASDDR